MDGAIFVLENFLSASVRMAAPLLLASLGLVVSMRAGLINIGVEGVMLMAAFAGYTGSHLTGSYWIGLLLGVIVAVLTILIFAVSTITFRANQVIIGTAINMLAIGLSSFFYRWIFHGTGRLDEGIAAETFPRILPVGLSDIPILGSMFFSHNILVYFGFVMVIVLWVLINKTSLGLRIIAVGDHPKAADSVGINVIKVRYWSVIFSGVMMGFGGAFLSIAQASSFGEEMTAGRGFIAIAVVLLGKFTSIGSFLGALVFGAASALQMLFQTAGIEVPRNLIMMIPYIATVIAVLIASRQRLVVPRALGEPYEKA